MEENKKKIVELEDGEAVYSIAEIEELLKQRDEAVKAANTHLITLRQLHGDVKKIHNIIPIENGKVNQIKLMGTITNLMKNDDMIEAFSALGKFVDEFQKNNLVVVETKLAKK